MKEQGSMISHAEEGYHA